MRLFRGIEEYTSLGDTVVTVGSFDGVHSGHRSLLKTLRERATARGLKSIVVSFSPHPRVALGRADGLKLLSSDIEKEFLLNQEGIDALLLLTFDKQLSTLSYEEFVVEYLIKRLNMKELIIGFNHHMGHNGGGSENLLLSAEQYNFKAIIADEFSQQGEKISSTVVRKLIESGDITSANRLLKQPYLIIGETNSLGALAHSEPLKLMPPAGHYICDVDGIEQLITIDEELTIWSNITNSEIEIKVKERYEKR
ncbi:MAG: FAD synthetase [Rikenellaceae bacterium]